MTSAKYLGFGTPPLSTLYMRKYENQIYYPSQHPATYICKCKPIEAALHFPNILSFWQQTSLRMKDAISPNFHTEWSNSCLQDLANQTLLPLVLPNCTANNFPCDWARWAKQATQARQLFTSLGPSGLRRTGTASFRLT